MMTNINPVSQICLRRSHHQFRRKVVRASVKVYANPSFRGRCPHSMLDQTMDHLEVLGQAGFPRKILRQSPREKVADVVVYRFGASF